MLKKRVFWTRVRGDHKKFGNNNYIQGVIQGMQHVLCRDVKPGMMWHDADTGDCFIPVKCYRWQYERFTKAVEKTYPELCNFYITMRFEKPVTKEDLA